MSEVQQEIWRGRITGVFMPLPGFEDCLVEYHPFDDEEMTAEVMVDVPAIQALLRSVGSSDSRELHGRNIEISTQPLEGAPPFHESGYFVRLMPPEPRNTWR